MTSNAQQEMIVGKYAKTSEGRKEFMRKILEQCKNAEGPVNMDVLIANVCEGGGPASE